MAATMTSRLEEFFKQETDDNLRSILKYEKDSYTVAYLRDDVADQYTTGEIRSAIDQSRMDSLSAPIHEEIYAADHGKITCLVQCFEKVIEMNFVLEDGVGAVVALDANAMSYTYGLIPEARDIVLEERE